MTKFATPTSDLNSTIMLLRLTAVWVGSFFFEEIALREIPLLTITLHRVMLALIVLPYLIKCFITLK